MDHFAVVHGISVWTASLAHPERPPPGSSKKPSPAARVGVAGRAAGTSAGGAGQAGQQAERLTRGPTAEKFSRRWHRQRCHGHTPVSFSTHLSITAQHSRWHPGTRLHAIALGQLTYQHPQPSTHGPATHRLVVRHLPAAEPTH